MLNIFFKPCLSLAAVGRISKLLRSIFCSVFCIAAQRWLIELVLITFSLLESLLTVIVQVCTSKLPLSMKSFDPECWRKFTELKSATNHQKIYLNFSLNWSWLIFFTTGGGVLFCKVNLKFTPFLPVGSNATKLDSNQFYFSSLATPALLRVREMDLFSPLPHNPIPPHT